MATSVQCPFFGVPADDLHIQVLVYLFYNNHLSTVNGSVYLNLPQLLSQSMNDEWYLQGSFTIIDVKSHKIQFIPHVGLCSVS